MFSINLTPIVSLIVDITLLNIIFYHKKKFATNLIVWIFSCVTVIAVSKYIFLNVTQSRIMIYVIASFLLLVCFYLYDNNFTQIAFTFIAVWTISSMISIACSYFAMLNFGYLPLHDQENIKLFLYAFIYALIIPLIKYKLVETIRNVLHMFNRKLLIFLLFPILSFVLFNTMFTPYINDKISQYNLIVMIMYISIIIFTYYFIFSTFEQIDARSKIEEKLKASQIQQSLQKDYYMILKESIDNINVIRHDSKHHLISIQTMLKSNDLVDLNKYINALISKEENIELPILCENASANAIVSYYVHQAKKLNIKTDVQINIPENIEIDPIDLTIVFGNCLENTIDACSKLSDEKQRYLNVKAALTKNYLVIEIKNSFNGIVNLQNDAICSTKIDAENHGIGLTSVKNVANQYSGTLDSSYTKDEFRISIMMYNRSANA